MEAHPLESSGVNIRLFGRVQINHAGQPALHFRSNQERALLAYLAVEAGHTPSREAICALIWPELSGTKARNNLRVTLSHLHQYLSGDAEVLLATRRAIGLNPAADIWIDFHAFRSLIETSQKHNHAPLGDCLECLGRYQRAADLFTGGFAEGLTLADNIPFTEWLILKREWLHRQALEVFYNLADYYLRRGELHTAQGCARRQLDLEPWREEAHRQLMLCFARNNQKSAALAQYEQCTRILAEELRVAPSYETQALYERIKRSRKRIRPALPAFATRFVGREVEQAEIVQALSVPECRLLTLVGMGGVGKTRLAAQIAAQFECAFLEGVIFVPLTAVQIPEGITNAIADALGFTFVGSGDPFEQLLNYLEDKEYLIVLDNFEHLLEAGPMLTQVWERCPGVNILVTSRQRLGSAHEYLVELEGLPSSLSTDPAVDLLLGCIRKLEPSFHPAERDVETILELCGRVEGMPLALELVAPMTRVLSLQEIIDDFHTLELSRLDAVFERSWSLLTPPERSGLMGLAVFKTPFTRQAASEVAQVGLTILTSLVDKSLLQRNISMSVDGAARGTVYFDFHPLLKQFAYQKLAGGPPELRRARESHANFFLGLLHRLDEYILTPDESPAVKQIRAHYEDFVSAMKWGCDHARYEAVRKGLRLFIHYFESYCAFHAAKKFYAEIVQILRAVKRQEKEPMDELNRVLARAIWYYGWQEMHFSEYEAGIRYEKEAVRLARETQDGSVEAGALNAIGVIHAAAGNLDQSNQYLQSALEAAQRSEDCLEDRWHVASINLNLGRNALRGSNWDQASVYFDTAMRMYEKIGHYWGIANTYLSLGQLFMEMSRFEEAKNSLQKGLQIADTNNYQWVKNGLVVRLGDLALKEEDWKSAVNYYQKSLDAIEMSGDKNILEEVRGKLEEAKSRIQHG